MCDCVRVDYPELGCQACGHGAGVGAAFGWHEHVGAYVRHASVLLGLVLALNVKFRVQVDTAEEF